MVQKSRPVRATLTAAPAESVTEQENLEDPGDDFLSVAEFSSDDSPNLVQAGPFTATQLTAIQDNVKSSLDQALQSFPWSLGHDQKPGTFNTPHRRSGSAAPVGLNRPLEQNLQDKILRGEYIDFSFLLPDSLAQPQAPDIQLWVDDSIPGSSPVTMVCKWKPVIGSFHKWLDAHRVCIGHGRLPSTAIP